METHTHHCVPGRDRETHSVRGQYVSGTFNIIIIHLHYMYRLISICTHFPHRMYICMYSMPHECMHKRGIQYRQSVVCLSVCSSYTYVLQSFYVIHWVLLIKVQNHVSECAVLQYKALFSSYDNQLSLTLKTPTAPLLP